MPTEYRLNGVGLSTSNRQDRHDVLPDILLHIEVGRTNKIASIVLTEDDAIAYAEHLLAMVRNRRRIAHRLRQEGKLP